MGIRVGIDTGGTFTDLIAVEDGTDRWYAAKVPSRPSDPVAAVAAAVEQAGFAPEDVDFIVVGTTIGINAVITRSGADVRYLTTRGFEDIPYIQRIDRKYHYDFSWRKPQPFVERRQCIGIEERVSSEGVVQTELDAEQVRAAVADLAADGADPVAVAVCFLFSYANPANEDAAREVIREVAPELSVSLSHEVAPIWREYERSTAATLDAYLKPAVGKYVAGVTEAFTTQGIAAPWSLLKSNGGHAVADEARDRPAHVLLSGIAGGAIGGAHFARGQDADKAIVVDMGGTSCDVCLVVDSEPLYSSDFEIEFGLPVSVPSVNTQTIGAGGGSIGWVDPGGFLQVGPQSAGADPGPACYGGAGEDPTVTDANLLLGRLDPAFYLGGTLELYPERSREAMAKLAEPLGLTDVAVAASLLEIANENMANAIRIATVEEGIDPRDFAIVAIGGAGPMHAAEIAEAIGVDRVIVPPNPGLSSAFGALVAEVRIDQVRSIRVKSTDIDLDQVSGVLAELERKARDDFAAQSAVGNEGEVERSLSMRYEGQNYEQEIEVPGGSIGEAEFADIVDRYERLHDEFYGYRFDGIPLEIVRASVTITGGRPDLPQTDASNMGSRGAEGEESRDVYFREGGFQRTAVVDRARTIGQSFVGPMIVQAMDTTVVVPPGWSIESHANGVLELARGESGDPPGDEAMAAAHVTQAG